MRAAAGVPAHEALLRTDRKGEVHALKAYEKARRKEFSGKWKVERMVGAAVAFPASALYGVATWNAGCASPGFDVGESVRRAQHDLTAANDDNAGAGTGIGEGGGSAEGTRAFQEKRSPDFNRFRK